MFGGDAEGGFGSSSEEDELENFENSENLENLETDKKYHSHDIDIDWDHTDNQAKPSSRKIENNEPTNRESIKDNFKERNNSKLNRGPQTDNKESFKNNFRDRDVSKLRKTADSTNNRESSFRGANDSKLTKTLHQTNNGDSNKNIFSEKDKIRKEKVPLVQIRISKPGLPEEKKRKRTKSGKIL